MHRDPFFFHRPPESMEERLRDFDHSGNPHEVLDRLGELLPDLTADQRRRVAAVLHSTCPECHAADRDCQCWNDE